MLDRDSDFWRDAIHYKNYGMTPFVFPVTELGALNARGGSDALNGRNPAERGEFFRRERMDHPPPPLEFIQLGNEPENLGCDRENWWNHTGLAD